MRLTSIPQHIGNAKRFRDIVHILAKYGLADWVADTPIDFIRNLLKGADGKRLTDRPRTERIRLALTELGTTFIKLGQVLSTRADVVGPELAEELTQLQSNTPADPPETVRTIVEAELGKPIEELYDEFDLTPLASASIAQVHRARTKDGQQVVVKVQHEGIEETVKNDLEILAALAQVAEKYSSEARLYRPTSIAEEFRSTLTRELDFTRERRNLESFNRNFRKQESVQFPRPFAELSSQRVLTMEMFDGMPFSKHEELAAGDIDTSKLATAGANLFLDMVFRDGFYHADPHPGNLMLLPTGAIGVLDCGMVGRLDDFMRDEVEALVLAAVGRNAEQLTDVIVRIGSLPTDFDRDKLRADVADFVADYIGQSLDEFDLSGALLGITEIIRRYRIILPSSMSLLLRVLVMLEGTGRNLNPQFSLSELLQPYYAKAMRSRYSPRAWARRLQRSYAEWDRLLDMLPKVSTDVLLRVRRGTFNVNLEHRRLDTVVNRLVLGIITAALFVGSAMLWASEARPLVFGVSVFGVLGCFTAAFLGLRLLIAIRRSGDIGPHD